jgi:hypothetical protein
VLSRYDLKLGLWDLARDAGLRESLLSPKTINAAPAITSHMPETVASSAARSETSRNKRHQSEAELRGRLHHVLWPLLQQRGWRTWDPASVGKTYILPQGDEIRWSDYFAPSPILFYELKISKRQSVLRLRTPPFGFTAIRDYLREQSEALRGVTGLGPDEKILYRFQGQGWENQARGSQTMVELIDAIVDTLAPSLGALRSLAQSEFATFRSQYPVSRTDAG